MAHTALAAQTWAARVVTSAPETWACAHPDVDVTVLDDLSS
jgi:hypothetical protein